MKTLKVIIEIELKGDENDEEMLKQDIYQYVQELIDEDDLQFHIVPSDDDEEEENF